MSTAPPMSNRPDPTPPGAPPAKAAEITLISHSNLFYWWPVWLLAFVFAGWTYVENHRLAIVPPHGAVVKTGDDTYTAAFKFVNKKGDLPEKYDQAAETTKRNELNEKVEVFKPRVSAEPALGSVFVLVLVLTLVITNVPLRGLWSFIVIIGIVTIALFITVLNKWDDILQRIGDLHIYINMAGYLFIGTAVFIVWALATWVFDRRSYVTFTPGAVRYCEHIGDAEQMIPTMGMSLKKERDDIFRHYILGFGSGDLVVQPGGTGGGDRKEIRLPNVLGIGWRLRSVQDMIATMGTQER